MTPGVALRTGKPVQRRWFKAIPMIPVKFLAPNSSRKPLALFAPPDPSNTASGHFHAFQRHPGSNLSIHPLADPCPSPINAAAFKASGAKTGRMALQTILDHGCCPSAPPPKGSSR
jgi:hypothetical protein